MDYLKLKWTIWFKSLDSDHDGRITTEDMQMSAKKFDDIRKLIGENGAGVAEFDNTKWWNSYIFRRGPGVALSLEDFIAALEESYQKDKTAFRHEMERCFGDVSAFMTDNKDRPIQEKEFIFGFKVFGQEDLAQVAKAYTLFTAGSGQPTIQQIVDAWVQFIADDDAGKQDMIKEAFGN
ncbi:sarcoplasmic calcium-binding protein-like [Ostrea edulis]|uniref:sarcoplasmic calcium-binding protein-like n=1 Tax=Ostrea edulis TaxID=37623 RepID=UPI0024AFB738|nr:sarcoplasmic calcium-binding protein-like [Ostrea edulis]